MNKICIDTKGITGLTYGKMYKVSDMGYGYYEVINDNKHRVDVYENRFLTLEEYRELRINQILEE